jgi:hypothetical protein
MTFLYAHAPVLTNVQFKGGTEPALFLEHCNKPVVEECLFINGGSSGTAQLSLNQCTAFTLKDNYIAGSANAVAGIDINRSSTGLVIGGAIESTGVPIRIAEAVEGTVGCGDITIQSVNMENPTNCYIRMGYGWTSTYGVRNIYILGCRGYVSGSTTAFIAVDMKHCLGVDVLSCQFGLDASATAVYNLNSTTNAGVFIGKNRAAFGNATPWVVVNSTAQSAATPLTDWASEFNTNQMIYVFKSSTTSTLDNVVFSGQGGLYNSVLVGNASPVTINRTSAVPSFTGSQLTLIAYDGKITVSHLGGGGTGQFSNLSGANINMVSGQALSYTYNGNTGNWSQI